MFLLYPLSRVSEVIRISQIIYDNRGLEDYILSVSPNICRQVGYFLMSISIHLGSVKWHKSRLENHEI